MKIRNGFVSNSSTSSFYIYGICLDKSEDDIAKRFKENTPDEIKKTILDKNNELAEKRSYVTTFDTFEAYIDHFDEDVYEMLSSITGLVGLEMHSPEYYDAIYMGIDPSNIGDDETGKEFKTRVETLIKSLFGDDITGFGWHAEAWRDG